MSDNRFVFDGIDELREALRNLPAELAAEAAGYVTDNAEAAVADVRRVYEAHVDSGNLVSRLFISTSSSAFGAGALVRNTAKHAWLFENGSQARHWTGPRGTGKSTGEMWGKTAQPPSHTFIRSMMKHRKHMYEQLRAMLERHGLEVTGEP
jgi:hypothetical protein